MLILFPSDYFNRRNVEPDYVSEYEAVCQIPEFKVVLYNYDGFVSGEPIKLYPKDYSGDCIYRGWMLTPEQYSVLYSFLLDRGIFLINSPEEYSACHLFPSVYGAIKQYTPLSLCFEQGADIDWEFVNKTLQKFIIKDYVKSVKGTRFPSFFETPVEAAMMNKRISEFVDLRGALFTGGIVLKEYVDFRKYGETTNEYRAFFLQGQLLSLCRNSNQPETCEFISHEFVHKFSKLRSNYYTVDFGELANGRWIVIETGDGQVSGLSPNQYVFKYYDDMRGILGDG